MTYLGWKVSGLPSARIFGMGGVLDSARFAYAIAEETGAAIETIDALAMGAHGDAMVPLPRHSTVGGTPLTELLAPERVEALVKRTVFGGAEVVALLKTGSAFYAPAASVSAMVEAVLGTQGRSCRAVSTSTASTASPTSTCPSPHRSAATACEGSPCSISMMPSSRRYGPQRPPSPRPSRR
jgi:malate dehydrogenase